MTVGLRRDWPVQLDANGAGQTRIANPNSGMLWVIKQLSLLSSPKQSGCTCTVTPPTGIVDTSYFAGTGDTAQGEYYLYSGDYIQLDWSDGPAGGTGIATTYYDEIPV